jgi:hypothetical protein
VNLLQDDQVVSFQIVAGRGTAIRLEFLYIMGLKVSWVEKSPNVSEPAYIV